MKADAKELEMHRLIIEDNHLALSKLFDLYGGSITAKLSRFYPKYAKMDKVLILASVNEAFRGYAKNPNAFDPEKNSLKRFLEIAAERDLKNLLEKERKYIEFKNELPDDVELEEKVWNSLQEGTFSPQDDLIVKQTFEKIENELRNHFKNERDIELAKLIIAEVRETYKFSNILGVADLSKEEQEEEVKRHKDRIKQVLKRHDLKVTIKRMIYER